MNEKDLTAIVNAQAKYIEENFPKGVSYKLAVFVDGDLVTSKVFGYGELISFIEDGDVIHDLITG